jgi:hypothetical protein
MDITEFRVIRTPFADKLGSLKLRSFSNIRALAEDRCADIPPTNLVPTQLETPLERFYFVLNEMNIFLRRANDWLIGDEVASQLTTLREMVYITEEDWFPGLSSIQFCLTQWLIDALMVRELEYYTQAVQLTRLTLVLDLISLDTVSLTALNQSAVFEYLNQRSVILPDDMTGTLNATARVQLIREATVADLHVIRREWSCYVLGEIANIRNVMAGETFTQKQTQFIEQETIVVNEQTRQETVEQEDNSKLASELSQEINTQLNLSVNGFFNASAQYKTPVATVNISGGADVGLSLQRGERFASKVARESVTKATRRVDTRTRQTRTARELKRNEDIMFYRLSNTSEDNLRGIYRWVDRVDRYQLFRYPERLQLEFQLPEPAEFYRKRTQARNDAAASVDKPPEKFEVKLEEITPQSLLTLAAKYRASNLPSRPDEMIALSRTLTLELTKDALPANDQVVYNIPSQSKELDIPVPTNYLATQVRFSGHGYPIWGKWRTGSVTVGTELEGFHSGFASVSIGDRTVVSWVGGYRNKETNLAEVEYLASYGDQTDKGSVGAVQTSTQAGPLPIRSVPYGRAMLLIGSGADVAGDLQPDPSNPAIVMMPGVGLSLKVGINTTGLAGCLVTFFVQCQLTDEAKSQWKLSVYDALFSAWSQWNKEYESAQLRREFASNSSNDAGSSQRNEQIIREELKRQVISWLLDEENFSGRPALLENDKLAKFRGIDFNKVRESAPIIQFLEQAFEWGNLLYIFYPYYWADSGSWESLTALSANDAEFERFLRAGSARVVVPVRPGFNDAVNNWLQYQIPFITGQLPTLNDDLYVSIDREIRDLTAPWEGGIAEDTWEARVSTTFLYLEDRNIELPFKNDAAVLPVDKNEVYKPKPICQ